MPGSQQRVWVRWRPEVAGMGTVAAVGVQPMRLSVDVREWEPRRRTGVGTFLEMFLGEAPRQRPGLTPCSPGMPPRPSPRYGAGGAVGGLTG